MKYILWHKRGYYIVNVAGVQCRQFSVHTYGSQDAARAVARQFRDQACLAAGRSTFGGRGCGYYDKGEHSVSGVTGVVKKTVKKYEYWTALYRDGDRQMQKKFSVLRYGDAGAMDRAVEFRNSYVKQCGG